VLYFELWWGLECGFWGQVCVKPKHDGERGVAGLPRHFVRGGSGAPTGRAQPLTANKKTLFSCFAVICELKKPKKNKAKALFLSVA
jgi:hypothetical protein